MATMKIILDRSQVMESRGRTITLGEIVDQYCAQMEEAERVEFLNEDGEADLSKVVAFLAAGKYWKDRATTEDNARRAAKILPSKVYGAALKGIDDAAAAMVAESKETIAKLAGITLAAPKAPKAPPVEPLAQAMAKVLAEEPKPAKADPVKALVKSPKALSTPKGAPVHPQAPGAALAIATAPKARKAKAAKPVAKPDPAPVEPSADARTVTLDNGSSFKVESY